MDEESRWVYTFYPSDSRSERILKLEALLAHKVANGEPIADTVKVLQILRSNQQSFLAKAFMQWVRRSRPRCSPKQETAFEHSNRVAHPVPEALRVSLELCSGNQSENGWAHTDGGGFVRSIFVSIITSLIVLTIFFGWYEADGGKAHQGSNSAQSSLLKK
ncbi:MAG: hypothetical protein KME49_22645 [Brasilonema octagenarum HA4186-MV1]|jgi:hypothetical protein|nr:hypothetical protein [Brasilonema octagenarum HA4186-MV1]